MSGVQLRDIGNLPAVQSATTKHPTVMSSAGPGGYVADTTLDLMGEAEFFTPPSCGQQLNMTFLHDPEFSLCATPYIASNLDRSLSIIGRELTDVNEPVTPNESYVTAFEELNTKMDAVDHSTCLVEERSCDSPAIVEQPEIAAASHSPIMADVCKSITVLSATEITSADDAVTMPARSQGRANAHKTTKKLKTLKTVKNIDSHVDAIALSHINAAKSNNTNNICNRKKRNRRRSMGVKPKDMTDSAGKVHVVDGCLLSPSINDTNALTSESNHDTVVPAPPVQPAIVAPAPPVQPAIVAPNDATLYSFPLMFDDDSVHRQKRKTRRSGMFTDVALPHKSTDNCIASNSTLPQDVAVLCDDMFANLPVDVPRQAGKSRARSRRSADFDVINAVVVLTPSPDLPVKALRRSRRIRRKSMELCRSIVDAQTTSSSMFVKKKTSLVNSALTSVAERVTTSDSPVMRILTVDSANKSPIAHACASATSTFGTSPVDGSVEHLPSGASSRSDDSLSLPSAGLIESQTIRATLPGRRLSGLVNIQNDSFIEETAASEINAVNRDWRSQMPTSERRWTTITEENVTARRQCNGRAVVRSINFDESCSKPKLRMRRQRAMQRGWRPATKAALKRADKQLTKSLKELDRLMQFTNADNE